MASVLRCLFPCMSGPLTRLSPDSVGSEVQSQGRCFRLWPWCRQKLKRVSGFFCPATVLGRHCSLVPVNEPVVRGTSSSIGLALLPDDVSGALPFPPRSASVGIPGAFIPCASPLVSADSGDGRFGLPEHREPFCPGSQVESSVSSGFDSGSSIQDVSCDSWTYNSAASSLVRVRGLTDLVNGVSSLIEAINRQLDLKNSGALPGEPDTGFITPHHSVLDLDPLHAPWADPERSLPVADQELQQALSEFALEYARQYAALLEPRIKQLQIKLDQLERKKAGDQCLMSRLIRDLARITMERDLFWQMARGREKLQALQFSRDAASSADLATHPLPVSISTEASLVNLPPPGRAIGTQTELHFKGGDQSPRGGRNTGLRLEYRKEGFTRYGMPKRSGATASSAVGRNPSKVSGKS